MRVVNRELAHQLEAAEAAHWASLLRGLAAIAANPYEAEIHRFGSAVALLCPGMPLRPFVNRVMLAERPDDTMAAIRHFRARGLRCRVDVTPFTSGEIIALLEQEGFHQRGFQTALYLDNPAACAPTFDIRPADTPTLRAFVAGAMPAAFDMTEITWIRWLTDSMHATYDQPGWQTYVAFANGEPAAFAQLHVEGSTACLAVAGTLPPFRGRGAQTALIERRIADAVAAGCDLICTQTGPGTVSQHNMERAGFRIAYTKAEFYDS